MLYASAQLSGYYDIYNNIIVCDLKNVNELFMAKWRTNEEISYYACTYSSSDYRSGDCYCNNNTHMGVADTALI